MDSRFCTQFLAIIEAVQRQGEHIKELIGDIKLCARDTLLVEMEPGFVRRFENDSTIALFLKASGFQPPYEDSLHLFYLVAILIEMVGLATAEVLLVLTASALEAFLLIVTACLPISVAAYKVDLYVIIKIAAGFGTLNGIEGTVGDCTPSLYNEHL